MKLDKIAILAKITALECDKIQNRILAKYDLTSAQFKILRYLYSEPDESVRLIDLEKFFSLRHPTAIGIIQNLEKKGLIIRKANPHHARSRLIVLTEKARTMETQLDQAATAIENTLTEKINEEEKNLLLSIMKKMLAIEE